MTQENSKVNLIEQKEHTKKAFSKNIKELRSKLKLTQSEFAERLGISRAAISLWEKGERTPNYTMVLNIVKEFGVSLDWLLDSPYKDAPVKVRLKENTENDKKINGLLNLFDVGYEPEDIAEYIRLSKEMKKLKKRMLEKIKKKNKEKET